MFSILIFIPCAQVSSGNVEHYPEHLEVQQQNDEATHKAPVITTSLHMVKLSIGTGVLAIPFAASQGGLLFHILGLFVMTIWNIYSVHCLAESRMYVEGHKARFQDSADNIHHHKEPKNTNTFGMITWYALGSKGLHALDFILTLLMFGVIIAYEGKFILPYTGICNFKFINWKFRSCIFVSCKILILYFFFRHKMQYLILQKTHLSQLDRR